LIQSRRKNILSIYNAPEVIAKGKGRKTVSRAGARRPGRLSSLDMSPPVRHLRSPSPVRHLRTPIILTLSKFSSTPTTEHLSAATYTLRYLRNTANLAIQYNASDSEATIPAGYTDADFAGDPDDRKSTSGYVFKLSGGAITWRARKQPLVAYSTVEAEYEGASDAAKEAIWVRSL